MRVVAILITLIVGTFAVAHRAVAQEAAVFTLYSTNPLHSIDVEEPNRAPIATFEHRQDNERDCWHVAETLRLRVEGGEQLIEEQLRLDFMNEGISPSEADDRAKQAMQLDRATTTYWCEPGRFVEN